MGNNSVSILWIKRLIWTYFFLLIFEGALRKWIAPSLSAPLLIIRVPFAVVIYIVAFQAKLFPINKWITSLSILALLCLFAGLYVDQDTPVAALYGFQADFLHLPLIFLIPKVFDIQDVRKLGYWAMLLSIPMALLMAIQFEASPSAWINAGAGEGSSQITGGAGHIRPAGTFSFITGPAFFFPLVTAFLLSTSFLKMQYPRWLIMTTSLALLIGTCVSSSRTLALSIGTVLICGLIAGSVLQPYVISRRLIARTLQGLCVLGIVLFVAAQFPIFKEGIEAFSMRLGPGADGAQSLAQRSTSYYTDPLAMLSETPILGKGLGLGTNAGVALTKGGEVGQILAEGEWARVVLESGPILGGSYILLRVILGIWLGWLSVRASRQGNSLPFLLFGSSLPVLLQGQFGQPTQLGFAVLGGGLTLAAMQVFPALQAATAGTAWKANDPRSGVAA